MTPAYAVHSVSLLLAQAAEVSTKTSAPPLDPLSGGAGWTGAGLLGLVLMWLLLKYLPSQNRMFMELNAAKDAASKEDRKDYRESLREVLAHCGAENTRISDKLSEDIQDLTAEVKQLRAPRRSESRSALHPDTIKPLPPTGSG